MAKKVHKRIPVNSEPGQIGSKSRRSKELVEQRNPRKLKVFEGVGIFYGHGTVYITDGHHGVQSWKEIDYAVNESYFDAADMYMETGAIVALPSNHKVNEAIEQLELVLRCLRRQLAPGITNQQKRPPPVKKAIKD